MESCLRINMTTPASPLKVTSGNIADKAALVGLVAFLFLLFSRVIEFVPVPKLQLLLSIVVLIITGVTGRFLRAFSTTVGKLMAVFTGWLVICIPFSVWPGGSIHVVAEEWGRTFIVLIMVCALVVTLSDTNKVLRALAMASIVVALMATFMGGEVMGRLVIGNASLGNSNDLAQFLMVGLPFWFLKPEKKSFLSPVTTIVRYGAVALIVMMVLRTGSRGALVGIAAMGVTVLLRLPATRKFAAVVSFLVLAPVTYTVIPEDMRARYATMFSGESPAETFDADLASAIASKQERMYMLKKSIVFTFTNPVFGVGPGQFSVACSEDMEAEGRRAAWLETHNAYTQVSSESGLPGFLLYGAALLLSCRKVRRVDRLTRNSPNLQHVNRAAACLWVSLVGFLTTSLFSSIAYHPQVIVLLGICTVFAIAFDAEVGARLLQRSPVLASTDFQHRPSQHFVRHPRDPRSVAR